MRKIAKPFQHSMNHINSSHPNWHKLLMLMMRHKLLLLTHKL